MRNALKQTVLLWTLLLLLTTWLGFFAVSAVVKYAVVVILVAVTAAVMAYWHKKKGQVVADDVWPSSLPPETYRQPVVLVCGDMSAHLFTDSPVRQVSEGLYLPVSDEEQLVAQVERLLTLRPAWASQFAVAYTVMPGMYRDAAVLTGRQLPDKAVDLLDTAGARVRMSLDTLPEPLTQLHARLAALDIEREAIEQDSVFYPETSPERLAELTDLRDELQAEAGHLEAQYQQEKALAQQIMTLRQEGTDSSELQQQLRTHQGFAPLLALDVDARAVATVVADWTGIPLSSLLRDEQSDLLSMEQSLENRVVGQSPALCAIAQRLRAAKTGLTPENGPQGVFLLTGPSGTGKTETALTLADTLFGGEKSLITINLSEYQEPHTVSQLKGSPPGYVGYGQGGVLTEAVRKRPYSVVLLDEVEKAHRDVMNLFYQVFDRGFMRDGEGRVIDFRNTVILMTANLGSDHIMQLLEEKPDATDADLHELLYPLLRDHFQPALMARFQTVIYRPLGQEAMRTIVEMKLAQVVRRLHQHYGLETEINDSLYDQLTAACLLPDTGARNIDSLLNQQILPVLSQQLLAQQAVHHKPARLRLGWDEEDGIVLEFDEK